MGHTCSHTPQTQSSGDTHMHTQRFTVTLTKRDNMGTCKAGSTSSAQRHTPTVSGFPQKPLMRPHRQTQLLTHGEASPWHRLGWINVALVTERHTSFCHLVMWPLAQVPDTDTHTLVTLDSQRTPEPPYGHTPSPSTGRHTHTKPPPPGGGTFHLGMPRSQ